MSYSRWPESVWYTYANVAGGFTVHFKNPTTNELESMNFSNEELRNIPECLRLMESLFTKEQAEELAGYMAEYVAEENHRDVLQTHNGDE